jgi:hypothetical protein
MSNLIREILMSENGDRIAEAIEASLIEDKTSDYTNVATALGSIAYQLKNLGNADAATPMGAIEAHGKVVSEAITDGLSAVADAMSEQAEAQREIAGALHSIAEALSTIAKAISHAG